MSNLPTPPAIPGSFFLGNFAEVTADKLGSITRYSRTQGDLFALRLGPLKVVVVNQPSLIEEVLVTRAKSFTKGWTEQLIRPAAGNGILLSENDFWKRQRRMVQPPFHRQRLAGYGDIMVRIADEVSAAWKSGEVRDVYPDTTRIGLSVAAKTLFDVDALGEADGLGLALNDVMQAVLARINSRFLLPDFIPTPNMRRLKSAVKRLDKLLYRAIAERRANPTDKEDLLSLLLAARDEDDGQAMSDRQLRDEAMTLFLAGFETTAINLSWVLHLLSRHPEAQARLRAEVSEVVGARKPAAGDLPRLKYVEAVINEALRLYPPAWAMDRFPVEELELGGFRIRKGVDLWMLPWVMHRDPRFWPEPEKFDPDRWLGVEAKQRPKFAYFPFGGGPRVCIGNAFAMMESVLVVSTLAQRFSFSTPEKDASEPLPDPGFTLRPQPGVTVQITHLA